MLTVSVKEPLVPTTCRVNVPVVAVESVLILRGVVATPFGVSATGDEIEMLTPDGVEPIHIGASVTGELKSFIETNVSVADVFSP